MTEWLARRLTVPRESAPFQVGAELSAASSLSLAQLMSCPQDLEGLFDPGGVPDRVLVSLPHCGSQGFASGKLSRPVVQSRRIRPAVVAFREVLLPESMRVPTYAGVACAGWGKVLGSETTSGRSAGWGKVLGSEATSGRLPS